MNATEFAARLDGVAYGHELDDAARQTAKENGLVVIFGASDDLMEIDGAIMGEADVWNGGVVMIDRQGVHRSPDFDCEAQNCPYYRESLKRCIRVRAIWNGQNKAAAWAYDTDVPHAEFRVFEDGNLWCMGIVLSINDIPQ